MEQENIEIKDDKGLPLLIDCDSYKKNESLDDSKEISLLNEKEEDKNNQSTDLIYETTQTSKTQHSKLYNDELQPFAPKEEVDEPSVVEPSPNHRNYSIEKQDKSHQYQTENVINDPAKNQSEYLSKNPYLISDEKRFESPHDAGIKLTPILLKNSENPLKNWKTID
jgi:hypothetical protein